MSVVKSFHQHYHFVRQWAKQAALVLSGATLEQAFTTSKSELVFLFKKGNHSYVLKVVAQFQSGFLLFDEYEYVKGSNAQAVFVNVHQQPIHQIIPHSYNRSFEIIFENNHRLIFKCYDALINVVEVLNDEVYNVFREAIQNDWQYQTNEFHVTDETIINKLDQLQVTEGEFWVIKSKTQEFALRIAPTDEHILLHTTNALEASTVYARYALGSLAFRQQKISMQASLQGEIKRLKQQVKVSEQGIYQLQHDSPFEELGHIIMANLHTIPKGAERVELFDFYRQKNIYIKLKTDMDAAENAAYYYRKAKNKKIELEQMEQKLLSMRTKLNQTEILFQQVSEAQTAKDLRSFKSVKKQDAVFPFKKFVVQEFEIWVGKNAQNNDLLTQKFAHKNDLWLHAKDVSGSHTVIKHKAGKPFNKQVITIAAQIAAYYSKHKGNTLAPVSYTLKKFVRKPKGAEPGSVMVDREEVVLVEPKLP